MLADPCLFYKKIPEENGKTKNKKGTEISCLVNKCREGVGAFPGRTPRFMWNNKEKNGLHTKEWTRNDARQETTQTTLVDNLESLQSGNAVLFFYTNKLIYLSTLYLKSYVHPLFYITVYIIKKPYENIFTSQRIINHPQSVPSVTLSHSHTRTHAVILCFLSCSTQYRRHSKRVVQQRAYKTVQIWLWDEHLHSHA